MAILLKSGRRRCDSRCHNALHTPPSKCRCICGGENHNKRFQSEKKLKEIQDELGAAETPTAVPMDGMITGDWQNREVHIGAEPLSPAYSQAVYNHSPDGFNWSYGGSGPAQLALAILLKFLPKGEALEKYQQFKWDVIAPLPERNFSLPIAKIHKWIAAHRQIAMPLTEATA